MPSIRCLPVPTLRIPCIPLNSGATGLTIPALAGLVGPFITSGPAAIVIDQKAQGVNGGTFTSGAWQTRDLQTVAFDPFGILGTVAANQVTLDSGIWGIIALPPALAVNRHQSRIQNITLGTTIATGQSTDSGATQNISMVFAIATLSVDTVIEIQHQSASSNANVGFGRACNFTGSPELYTSARFTRFQDLP